MNRSQFEKLSRQFLDKEDELELYKNREVGKPNYYPYIPFTNHNKLFDVFFMLKRFVNALNNKKPKFVDIGAGTGRIVKLAQKFGFDAFGIEYVEKNVSIGRKLYGLSDEELFQGDAFELTRKQMADVNIVYTYMPIHDSNLMTKLHMHLATITSHRTIIAEMLPKYYPMNLFCGSNLNIFNRDMNCCAIENDSY